MARVKCPICKTGFEAKITPEDYAINCIACGIAFNAAQYLPREEYQRLTERRGGASSFTKFAPAPTQTGTLRALEPVYAEPLNHKTRTGGLPFMQDEAASAAVAVAPAPVAVAAPVGGVEPATKAPTSFLEAVTTQARFRSPLQTQPPAPVPAPVAVAAPTPVPAEKPAQIDAPAPVVSRPPTGVRVGVAPNLDAAASVSEKKVLKLPGVLDTGVLPPAMVAAQAGRLPSSMLDSAMIGSQALKIAEGQVQVVSPNAVAMPAPAPAPEKPVVRRRPLLEGAFGHFEIEDEIARGGVGAVFRVRHTVTGAKLALKVLIEDDGTGDLERERFRRECETAKSLSLPGMVKIHEVGEVDGKPYMAMELIEGRSLDKLIAEKSLSVHDALVIMESVARTVGELHAAGYVHRDLKPANILLDAYGSPKVADFGLVKSVDEVTRLTASGLVCGTPAYMSPEQARGDGQAVEARTDVWALGAVLYEMLTGKPPFQADNALRLMLQITKEDPLPARVLNPKIPTDVEVVVKKCLSKSADKRYPNGSALAKDLQRFLEGAPIEAKTRASVRRIVKAANDRKGLFIGVSVGLAGVVVVALLARMLLAPQDAHTRADQGWASLEDGQLKEAEDSFRAAIRADPKQASAYLGLARVLGTRALDVKNHKIADLGLFKEAREAAAKAAQYDDKLAPDAAVLTAAMFRCAKMYRDAVDCMEHAVELKPNEPQYYNDLGLDYWNLGHEKGSREYLQSALKAFERVLELKPDYPKTAAYIKELKERGLSNPTHGATRTADSNIRN